MEENIGAGERHNHSLRERPLAACPVASERMSAMQAPRSGTRKHKLVAWLTGPGGRVAAFAWGAAEASFFFLVPDVLLAFVALMAPRRAWGHLVSAVLGALLMGVLVFSWSARTPQARAVIDEVPLVTAAMLDQAATDFREHGAWGAVLGPARGIPYKVYAVQAPSQSISLSAFVAASAPARLWRMLITVLAFAAIGSALRKWGGFRWAIPLHAVFWTTSFTVYALSVG
jgi:hypothetical protein